MHRSVRSPHRRRHNISSEGSSLFREARRHIQAQSTIPKAEMFYEPKHIGKPWKYSNHPGHKSGFHYNSHLRSQKMWLTNRITDHLRWGRELGEATNVFRNQRTAFDFNDSVHPTYLPPGTRPKFANQDPTMGMHPDLSTTFNPHATPFSTPQHERTLYRDPPHAPDIRLPKNWVYYQHRLGLYDMSMVGSHACFGLGDLPAELKSDNFLASLTFSMQNKSVAVPGIDMPYYGEPDRMNMESMARPLNKANTVCANEGRFSSSLYLNTPAKGNVLDTATAQSLRKEIDRYTNGILSKLTFLKSAQSGLTDNFCGGYDVEGLQKAMSQRATLLAKVQSSDSAATTSSSPPPASLRKSEKGSKKPSPSLSKLPSNPTTKVHRSLQAETDQKQADELLNRADRHLRRMCSLLWTSFSANRPLMSFINGACRNVGIGLALLPKYAVLRDSTEFINDGPNMGLTPFGAGTHFLAREETSTKYPGLAEFALLTGAPLYSGDALRLGWSDLFTTLPDIDYYVKEWFDNTEHMHNDAVTWQLGFLLDTTCRIDPSTHSLDMERVAVTKERAGWIAETFADQTSVEGIVQSLLMVESLAPNDPHNTQDKNMANPFTIEVDAAAAELRKSRLSYTLAPWDLTPLPQDMQDIKPKPLSDAFNKYYFEHDVSGKGHSGTLLRDPNLEKWREFRRGEYAAFKAAQLKDIQRHVYVKIDGVLPKTASFDFIFDFRDTTQRDTMLKALSAMAKKALGLEASRDISLGWCLPSCEIARVRHDEELLSALIHDPGYEDPTKMLKHPPIYLLVHRSTITFSEWAHSVNHVLLRQSPFALKATFRLLKEIQTSGDNGKCTSISQTLAIERRVLTRMMQRPDFHKVGALAVMHSPAALEKAVQEGPTLMSQGVIDPSSLFEERTVQGHMYPYRPRWSPATLSEVNDADVDALVAKPLRFEADGLCEIDVATETYMRTKAFESMEDTGIEVVPRLGTPDCPNATSTAHVPENVNFYEMARHPWLEYANSWRLDGYTQGSMKYLTDNYQQAEEYLYGKPSHEPRNYWQSNPKERAKSRVGSSDRLDEEPPLDNQSEALLRDRFWSVIGAAERGLDREVLGILQDKAKNGRLSYRQELATPEEKVYDDYYYQWFISPGRHPNPSGILK